MPLFSDAEGNMGPMRELFFTYAHKFLDSNTFVNHSDFKPNNQHMTEVQTYSSYSRFLQKTDKSHFDTHSSIFRS